MFGAPLNQSILASFSIGVPMPNSEEQPRKYFSSPKVAFITSVGWIRCSMAWRALTLLNGGWSQFTRAQPSWPCLFKTSSLIAFSPASESSRSTFGYSIMSISPARIAAIAVASSAMFSNTTRSTFTTLPPEVITAGSERGT